MDEITTEPHPLEPFLPEGAKLLMLGSFPPSRKRWSMDFFYPNFQNDMWRIVGFLFFDDKGYFHVDPDKGKGFDREKIIRFCTEKGIAIFDTASEIRRLKGTASDADLEIVKPTDIRSLLDRLPKCNAVAATGGKAASQAAAFFHCEEPPVGGSIVMTTGSGQSIELFRMPSTSRAYPIPLEKKASAYGMMFRKTGILI
ncbi:MAG: uracil-DNA glycosylase family protein [Bacteroidales bacterium]|jgi:G:T/U-mismatch repair DNA glycosylase|nr:uracil-DNA glycosylase family protein [Bacteroidales bacterium]MCI2122028.1 uracil-DNA glycosylase family protein [Bacteroidales bacterium]MCI2146217.1 uracil-DNA glycosylase family protein [Bacteroidales bacterium]